MEKNVAHIARFQESGDEVLAKGLSMPVSLKYYQPKKNVFPYTHTRYWDTWQIRNTSLHLITNGFEKTQRSKIRNSGTRSFLYTGHHFRSKQQPESLRKRYFDYAMTESRRYATDQSIMIGDNLDADIQGAINAGMDSCLCKPYQCQHSILQPTYTVTHLNELEQIF
jgi:putative hydrolase of the HAD superfamily